MKNGLMKIIGILIICLTFLSCGKKEKTYTIEQIREKFKKELKEDYGEEFQVDYIGTRSGGGRFYQAEITPKWVIGTKNEDDSYYKAIATMNIKPNGELGRTADSYGMVKMKIDMENFLMPKIKELFGEFVLLHLDLEFKRKDKDGYWTSYLGYKFEDVLKLIKNDPKNNKLSVKMKLYIINNNINDLEKEYIKDFLYTLSQYNLLNNLKVSVFFIEEIVLVNEYRKIRSEIWNGERVLKKVNDKNYYFIPDKKKKKYYSYLKKSFNKTSKKEKLNNFENIRKSEPLKKRLFSGYFIKSQLKIETEKLKKNKIELDMIKIKKSKTYIGNKKKY